MKKKKTQAVQKRSTQALSFVSQDKDSKKFLIGESDAALNQRNTESLKLLEEIRLQHFKSNFPNFDFKLLLKQPYRDDTENGLIKCIIDFIKLKGGQAFFIQSNHNLTQDQKFSKRSCNALSLNEIITNNFNSNANISANIKGEAVKIEINKGNDQRSVYDLIDQTLIEASGCLYFIAKDFNSFMDWYLEMFEIKYRRKIPYDTCISIKVCNRKLGQIINPILKSRKGGIKL